MDGLFNKIGDLSVVLGKGYLSAYEISRLSVGDVIQSSMTIATPCNIYFNNEKLCLAEIIISDDLLGIQISGFGGKDQDASFPGVADEITEVLPFTINLIRMKFSLRDLEGVTTGSLILGKKNDESAELYVAGFPVAIGRVVVIEDRLGIKITEVYEKLEPVENGRQSFYMVNEKYEQKIMYYDFAKPDRVSMNFINSVMKVHDYFCMNMSLLDRNFKKYSVLEVDQKILEEVFMEFDKNYSFYLFESKSVSRGFAAFERHDSSDRKNFKYVTINREIEDMVDKRYINDLTNWMKNNQKKPEKAMLMCLSSDCSMKAYKTEDDINQFITEPLRNAWKNIASLNFNFTRFTDKKSEVKIIPDRNSALIVKIGNPDKLEDFSVLIYSYNSLGPVLEILE